MYLPTCFVPLLLDASGYTIRQVWEILYPALVEANAVETCAPLLAWLRVASSGITTNQQGILGPPVNAISLFSPPADRDLILHRSAILQQVLPGLNTPGDSLEAALSQVAVAMLAQTNDA
jgi:hypothetical protein